MPTAATSKKMWFCPEIEQLVKEGAAATMKLKRPADLATVRSHLCSAGYTVFDKSDQVFSTFGQMSMWERSKQYKL
jgi:hypothetical protein